MPFDRKKLNLVGQLKHPVDLTVNGKVLQQVTRIRGNIEYGFVYEFQRDGKTQTTCEPLWHNDHAKHKRNDLPRFNERWVSRTEGVVIIKQFTGGGWWRVKNAQGNVINRHFHNLICKQ